MPEYPNSALLYFNDTKKNPKQPDYSGKGQIDGQPKDFAAWRREGKKGNHYLQLKVSEPYQGRRKEEPQQQEQAGPQPSDDVPPMDQGEADPF